MLFFASSQHLVVVVVVVVVVPVDGSSTRAGQYSDGGSGGESVGGRPSAEVFAACAAAVAGSKVRFEALRSGDGVHHHDTVGGTGHTARRGKRRRGRLEGHHQAALDGWDDT